MFGARLLKQALIRRQMLSRLTCMLACHFTSVVECTSHTYMSQSHCSLERTILGSNVYPEPFARFSSNPAQDRHALHSFLLNIGRNRSGFIHSGSNAFG
ncbi:hypothetical protein F5880DRAFT_79715 [Lentinula raphanica]|nr:hypothetical protein F5880DRAFT_79715 [Lentinula raphanica]